MRGYFPRGQRAHVVQVGLGDNRTFLHDMAAIDRRATDKGVGWLLSACTDGDICGVAVEPVWEHFEAADKLAASRLPNVKLVQAALGEYCGKTPIYRVEEPSHSELARLGLEAQEDFERQMSYLRNMSSVEGMSTHLVYFHSQLEQKFGLQVPIRQDNVPLWTWSRLVGEIGFYGCEVLIVDAEGFDVEILRSLAQYCEHRPGELPWVIQFESNGLCNARAGYDSESHIVTAFEKLGYILVGRGRDTYLALQSAATSTSMQNWLGSWRCAECRREHCYPYTLTPDVLCQPCADWVWKNWSQSQPKK